MKFKHIITAALIALLFLAGAASAAESIYEGSVTVITEDGTATVEDVYKAVAKANGFTHSISPWGTIADINGIENTDIEFWMTYYENNADTKVYSVADPVVKGAVITLEYRLFDKDWKPIETKYTAKITVADIITEKSAFPVTITDDGGYAVTVDKEPQTIVSLAPTNTEILFALGVGGKVIGDTDYCNYPEEAKTLPKIGGYSTINIEKIVALNPDIIYANHNNGYDNIEHLKSLGCTVILINPESIDGIYNAIEITGKTLGAEAEAEALIAEISGGIAEITEKLAGVESRPTVMHAMSVDPYWVSGSKTFQDELISLAGAVNAFSDVESWGTVTIEKLITTSPDIILTDPGADMGSPGENTLQQAFFTDPRLSDITAVKNQDVYVMDADIFDRGGPRVVEALDALVKITHPEIFGEHTGEDTAASSPAPVLGIIAGLAAVYLWKRKE